MVHITEKLKVKIKRDVDEKYRPANMTSQDWYEVVGYVSREYTKQSTTENETKTEYHTIIKFLVINDKLEISQVSSKNVQVSPFNPAKQQ